MTIPPSEISIRPRILLITEFYPEDPVTCVFGVFQRLQTHIEALARVGSIDAVFFWPEHQMPEEVVRKQADMVKQLWPIDGSVRFIPAGVGLRRGFDRLLNAVWAFRGAVGFFHTAASMRTCGREQASALRQCLQDLQPDLVFAYRQGAAAPLLRVGLALPPIVVDIDDIEYVKLRRLAASTPGFARRIGILAEAFLALNGLRRISAIAACLLVASEVDRAKIEVSCRGSAVAVIPNTAHSFGALPKAQSPVAFFVGTAKYPPNREAIIWLIREIWPLVRDALPHARLLLVGEGMDQLAADCPEQGVEGLGFIANLAPIYERVSVVVCPIQRGSGTRIKIIEAAMNARPVVSTTVGAEGLSLSPGTEILLGDSPADFTQACVRLLQDPELAAAVGNAAQKRVELLYSRSRVTQSLASLCAGIIGGINQTVPKTAMSTAPGEIDRRDA